MCGRVIQSSAPFRLAIVDGLDVRGSRFHNYPPRWNAAPSQDLLVIRRNRQTGGRSTRCAGALFLTSAPTRKEGAITSLTPIFQEPRRRGIAIVSLVWARPLVTRASRGASRAPARGDLRLRELTQARPSSLSSMTLG
jgi:hypothetical protein